MSIIGNTRRYHPTHTYIVLALFATICNLAPLCYPLRSVAYPPNKPQKNLISIYSACPHHHTVRFLKLSIIPNVALVFCSQTETQTHDKADRQTRKHLF